MDLNNMLSQISNYITIISDYVSIIGFIISICTFCLARGIKKELIQRVNIKRHKKFLILKNKELADYLNDYDKNKEEIEENIAIIGAKLNHVKKGNSDLMKHVKELKRLIKNYNKETKNNSEETEKIVRQIKTKLAILVDELNEQENLYKLGD